MSRLRRVRDALLALAIGAGLGWALAEWALEEPAADVPQIINLGSTA